MIITRTPLRVSLFGGGTDFPEFYEKYGGCVLTTAISQSIYVIVKPRFDTKVRVTYTKAELVNNASQVKHDIIRECLKYVGITNGIEVVTIGDIPSGTGLGSSSSLTVGVLNALYNHLGTNKAPKELAKDACYVEREVLKSSIGIQDQFIAAFGGYRYFKFTAKETITRKLVSKKLSKNFLLFFTGITRSAETILKEQKENTNKNIAVLSKMAILAWRGQQAMDRDLGILLEEGWNLKKTLSKTITTPAIDKMYDKAKKAGAIGGKVLGAGGGGFLLFYVPEDKQPAVRKALSNLKEIPFIPETKGSRVILSI